MLPTTSYNCLVINSTVDEDVKEEGKKGRRQMSVCLFVGYLQ